MAISTHTVTTATTDASAAGDQADADQELAVAAGAGTDRGPATSFADRHIGPAGPDVRRMLDLLGLTGLDALAAAVVPAVVRSTEPLDLPAAGSEPQALAELRALADRNTVAVSMIGLGYYDTPHPGGDPPQRAGEPGLVHRLHAVPAGDLARAGSRRC